MGKAEIERKVPRRVEGGMVSILAAGTTNNNGHHLLSSYYVPSLIYFISFDLCNNMLGDNFQSSSFYRK